jgi:hypothetical protein
MEAIAARSAAIRAAKVEEAQFTLDRQSMKAATREELDLYFGRSRRAADVF